jgi:hypothetical protein
LRITVSGELFVQIDCWLSVINGGYNYGDLLRDSSPHIKAEGKNLQSAESNAAFLERFGLAPPEYQILFIHLFNYKCKIDEVVFWARTSVVC